VLQQGQIVKRGTHERLVALQGTYAELSPAFPIASSANLQGGSKRRLRSSLKFGSFRKKRRGRFFTASALAAFEGAHLVRWRSRR